MVYNWFHKTNIDQRFYEEHIRERLPQRIVDAHVHMNLEKHVKNVSPERIAMDWALECGLQMDYEASRTYYHALFPDREVELVAFPFPLAEVDIPGNNRYLAGLAREKGICGLMSVRPEWSSEYCEETLLGNPFAGFKPYPYLASQIKGADISIYDFIPGEQLAVLDRHKKALVLHLPRRGRLPAPDNIRELREIRQAYPDIRIVLAHYGRCFTTEMFQKGTDALGEDLDGFYFDTAAVINPQVHRMAMERLDGSRIIYGTDLPIMAWHGIREWQSDTPSNYCREEFSWNHHEKRDEENGFTYIAYLQLKNMLDAIGENKSVREKIFYKNAKEVFRTEREGGKVR